MESDSGDHITFHYSVGLCSLYKERLFTLERNLICSVGLSILEHYSISNVPNRTAEIIWSGVGILLFSAYILYDTSEIVHRYGPGDEVSAALDLHLEFVNIFWDFIRLFKRTTHDTVTETADTSGDVTDLLDTD